jgi:hypothetical protein
MRADLVKFVVVRIAIMLVILAAFEFAFRLGIWEWIAKRESNAGQTIAMKRALQTLGPEKLDFVTFGDSRTVYGLDHERIAALAKAKGLTHASVAIPGMHWMSMEMLVRWLQQNAPQLRGAVIATTISDFKFLGNGAYELNMAAPLAPSWDSEWMARHVPLDHINLSTYGSRSALFLYREDIQDLLKHPVQRAMGAGALLVKPSGTGTLFSRQRASTDICQVRMDSVEACAKTVPAAPYASTVQQCRQWQQDEKQRPDFRDPSKFPHLAEVRAVREKQFRDLPYSKPVIVLLMPMPEIWQREVLPPGSEDWARAFLKSMQDQGLIEVHDFTGFFRGERGPECAAFWDAYHQNALGQDKLTGAVLPILEQRLYARKTGSQPAVAPK